MKTKSQTYLPCHRAGQITTRHVPKGSPHIGNSKGLTLIELMVVLSIIAVVAVVTIPSFSNIQRRSRVRGGASGLSHNFKLFRERALSKSLTYTVLFDIMGPNEYAVFYTDTVDHVETHQLGGPTGGKIKFGTTGGIMVFPPEGSVPPPGDGIDFPGKELIFASRGGATKGVIYINDGKDNYAIGVGSLGRSKVYFYVSGTWRGQ